MSGRAVRAAVGMALFVLLAGGCVQMPDSGPVVEVETDGDVAPVQGMYYVPRPPQAGESPTEIVRHFMEAMTATPIQTGVARQYLTDDAGAAWNPQRETIVFADSGNPVGSPGLASRVTVRLHGAQVLDHHGAFRGPLPRDRSAILFQLTTENGEWRITNPPNALIVPAHWFALQYQWVSLYFFDPSARTLVPEPAFVPRGDQFVASLVQALLRGPGTHNSGVVRSFLPPGLSLSLSVPVDEAGVAEVSLKGDVPRPSHQSLELALVQLAWTLRQDPSVRAIRLTVNGQPASIRGGDTPFDVDTGTEYDPTGAQASAQLYGLRGNRLLVGSAEAMTPVRTPLGRAAPLSRIGVNLDGTRLAAVTADHRSALTAAIAGPGNRLSEIGTATGRFLTPGWDFDDRLWLLDTGLGQARVTMVHAGTSQPLQVPGVSGRKVVDFTVSRDGSRIVAVVRHGNTDRVVVSRVAHDEKGRVVKALPGQIVYASRGSRIRDVGWETATTLAVLTPLTNRLAQVREIPIDGSLGDPAEATLTLSGSPRKLVTSPVENEVSYAVVSGGLLDLADALSPAAPVAARPMTVTYVG